MWGACKTQCQVCFRIDATKNYCTYVDCRGLNCYSIICIKCRKDNKVPPQMAQCAKCGLYCCYQYHYWQFYNKCVLCNIFINKHCRNHKKELFVHGNCKNKLINLLDLPKDLVNIIISYL